MVHDPNPTAGHASGWFLLFARIPEVAPDEICGFIQQGAAD
jgi:hypothetical protein